MTQPLTPAELFPAGMPSISVRHIPVRSGINMRVLESGPTGGEPAVLLHGWGASSYSFRHALALLPERGVRTIAVDLRGFGLSDKPMRRGEYTLDAYCADLTNLLEELALRQPALIGHSMGGGIALRYALRSPERVSRIVLINPVGLVRLKILDLARVSPRWPFRAFDGRMTPRALIGLILRHIAYGNADLVTDDVVDEYWSPTQLPGFGYAARAAVDEFDWAPVGIAEAASLAKPCVVILGDSDRLVRDARGAANRLAGATVHQLTGGHCVHEEDPARVYELIAQFVKK